MRPSKGESTEFPIDKRSPQGDAAADKVQCPNCCRLAPVTSRRMGLLFYQCELCGAFGATPEPEATDRDA